LNLLRSAAAEILGLFVDDWTFAILLIIWVGVITVLTPRLPASVAAPLFFVGLAALTLIFAVRQGRRLRSRMPK
jgi:hypothetical protein